MHSIRLFSQFRRWFPGQSLRLDLIRLVGTRPKLCYLVVVLKHADEKRMHFRSPIRLRGFWNLDSRLAPLLWFAHRGNETVISVPLPKSITPVLWACWPGFQPVQLEMAHVLRNLQAANPQIGTASEHCSHSSGSAAIERQSICANSCTRKYPRFRRPWQVAKPV